MRIIVHSTVGDRTIEQVLGADDYSYHFVRLFFCDALRRFATVLDVTDPATEVDPLFDAAEADGEHCVFLSFAPPHKTVLGLRCPVVPVFAWEFSTIPNEVWSDDIRNDWRAVFAVSAGAIALSSHTASVVRRAMGPDYPIAAIPAPVFERFRQDNRRAPADSVELRITGTVLDTDRVAAFRAAPVWPPEPPVPLLTPGPLPPLILPLAPVESAADAAAPEEPAAELLFAIEPEPEIVPDAVLLPEAPVVEPPVELVPVLVSPLPERIGWRRRAQITKHLGLEWYRLTVRDLLPRPVRGANALAGRALYRSYRLLRPLHPAPVQPGEGGQGLAAAILPPDGTLLAPVASSDREGVASRLLDPTVPAVPEAPARPGAETVEPVGRNTLDHAEERATDPSDAVGQLGTDAPAAVAAEAVDPSGAGVAGCHAAEATELSGAGPASPVATASRRAMPPFEPPPPSARVTLDGVVFATMFSPRDGRKNWNDIVTAFCWAFRDEPGATLVIKIVASDYEYEPGLRQLLGELAPLRCRVVVLHGFLVEAEYRALIGAASFYVNASHCEGLCLPLLEFMSAGTPAIAPDHTALADYVTPENSFVLPSGIENTVWPGDGRDLFRTERFRVDWHALMLSFREAHRVALEEPERYAALSANARHSMERFCAIDRVSEALASFLRARVDGRMERAA